MKKAILELKNNKVDLMNLVKDYQQSNVTKIVDNVLEYRTIPEGLMYLIHHKHGTKLNFINNFENFGTMLDLSRGAAYNLTYIKRLIRKHSLMGVNEMWLYIEDMYEVKKYPVFGYMRGRYSMEEIHEIVAYAKMFGVAVIPAIQTLGHMEQFLRWLSQTAKFKDQDNVILARDEETKDLIFEMLKTIKEMFQTEKIHIGLDETWGFGFGRFYKKHGYVPQMELFLEHLTIVNDMALEVGFKDVLVWSDMFFRFMSDKNSYYDTNIKFNEALIAQIPKNINLVYWDYYNKDKNLVDGMLKNHLQVTDKVTFASGTWIWSKLTYDKKRTDSFMDVHLEAAIENNIKDFFLTQWGDDGSYGNHETTIQGVYDAAIKALTTNEINKDVYKEINGEDYDVSTLRSILNERKMTQVAMLWDDPLFSVYLNTFTNNELENFAEVLSDYEEPLNVYKNNSDFVYEYNITAINYNKILGRKAMLEGYKNGRIEATKYYLEVIKNLESLINIFRDRWYSNYKMYGFEIIQSRLELQIARAKEMIILQEKFNNKEITHIDGLNDEVAIYKEYLYEKHSLIAFTTKPH